MLRLILFVILLSVPVQAEMPAGHDDPRLQAAVEAWLDGDDTALRTFHDMAGEGNVAALILRQRMSKIGLADADYPEPVDFFWLDFAADSQLALAFGISWHQLPNKTSEERITEFLDLGEFRHAAALLQTEVHKSKRDAVKVPLAEQVIEDVLFSNLSLEERLFTFLLAEPQLSDAAFTRVLSDLCFAEKDPSQGFQPLGAWCSAVIREDFTTELAFRSVMFGPEARQDPDRVGRAVVTNWLSSDQQSLPSRVCSSICADDRRQCVWSVYQVAWQLPGLLSIGSGVETLVPQSVYLGSIRAEKEYWDFVNRTWAKDGPLEKAAWKEAASCLVAAVRDGVQPWERQ
ncbi:MAG: hypothetical protein AAGK00_03900 [Pseudomonadota bacterium]